MELADLPEEVLGLDLEHGRTHDAHGAHAHDDRLEALVGLDQGSVRRRSVRAVMGVVGLAVRWPVGGLDAVHAAVGGHEVEGAHEVVERTEGDP